MSARVQLIGSYVSPYVRKVLVVLHHKGIDYEIDPIVPFYGDDRFAGLSPLRRIPVLIDGDVVLSDSSVICQYLEDRWPDPAVYPRDVADRARARWIEEFADTRMGDVLIWRYFNQLVIRRVVWGEEPDRELVAKTLAEDIPAVLDYLETLAPADGFLFGGLSIADISVATFFRNAAFARFSIDAGRWPRTAAWVARVLATDGFQRLTPIEDRLLRTPIAEIRPALTEMGAPLMRETYGLPAPRRGIMRLG